MRLTRPDFVAIGHITCDLRENGAVAGGSALYSALTAMRLGKAAAVVTASSPGFGGREALAGVDALFIDADTTTAFVNTYDEKGRRTQVVKGVAASLEADRIPPTWRAGPVIHVCPVVHEVGEDCLTSLDAPLVGVSPQGWLRSWNEVGRVTHTRWPEETKIPALRAARVLFFSDEEFALNRHDLDHYLRCVDLVAVTKGDRGVSIFHGGEVFDVPAPPVREVDPTGAGDVFATAFLVRLEETGDALLAARFACCAASYAVERDGIAGIPDRREVEERLRTMPFP